MDRVIPKDIIDLIYRESHQDNMKRLNTEYHSLFKLKQSNYGTYIYTDTLCYTNTNNSLNDRILCCGNRYNSIVNFKKRRITSKLPKRYTYSSGNEVLKWIE